MKRGYLRKLDIRLIKGEYLYLKENRIRIPRDIYKIFKKLSDKYQENLIAIYFDNEMRIIAYDILSIGNNNSVIYSPDEILKRSILLNSKRFILTHNHPSGKSNPSEEDENIMIDLKQRARILDIILLDFIIIGDKNYWSAFQKNEGGEYSVGSVQWNIRGNWI
jgi:DNA repair protein RadC